jgi:hypothetical protein
VARSKHRSVHKELHNLNWIRNLKEINAVSLMEEFILLFMALADVELSDQHVSIKWKWTEDSNYSVSAYECQFKGAIIQFSAMSTWQAKTEPKCKFYAWLVMHERVLTADNLLKRNWPCNEYCSLYYCLHETTEHLLIQYNYIEVVWNDAAEKFSLPSFSVLSGVGGPKQWV